MVGVKKAELKILDNIKGKIDGVTGDR